MVYGTTVRLEPVERSKLISALEMAAKDVGWKVEKTDNYSKEYRLGSVEEIDVLTNTALSFGNEEGFRAAEVCVFSDENPRSFGIDRGIADKEQIKEYLIRVSQHLK